MLNKFQDEFYESSSKRRLSECAVVLSLLNLLYCDVYTVPSYLRVSLCPKDVETNYIFIKCIIYVFTYTSDSKA